MYVIRFLGDRIQLGVVQFAELEVDYLRDDWCDVVAATWHFLISPNITITSINTHI